MSSDAFVSLRLEMGIDVDLGYCMTSFGLSTNINCFLTQLSRLSTSPRETRRRLCKYLHQHIEVGTRRGGRRRMEFSRSMNTLVDYD